MVRPPQPWPPPPPPRPLSDDHLGLAEYYLEREYQRGKRWSNLASVLAHIIDHLKQEQRRRV